MVPSYAGLNVFRADLHCSIQEAPLPGILRIEDANSMAASVENRVPFLTPTLVEYVQSLPDPYLVSPAGETKWVFREAMRGITPEPILPWTCISVLRSMPRHLPSRAPRPIAMLPQ